jgi:ArsR family transcriptional regulator, virulence genes transcriptional regulator
MGTSHSKAMDHPTTDNTQLNQVINYQELRKAAMVLRSLNHRLRQRILELIETHERLTVTEIFVHLRLEQSVASQHLAILRQSGIVRTERDGKFIFYSVDKERILQITELAKQLV